MEAEHEIVNIGQGAGQLRRPRPTRGFASPGRSDQPRYGTLWKSLRSAEDGATHISCCRRALARNCCDDRMRSPPSGQCPCRPPSFALKPAWAFMPW